MGRDPARVEEMRFLIANPTASLYNNRTQILAALEFACLDILGQAWGAPVYDILGGKLRDKVPFASYCFFRYPDPRTGKGEVRTISQLVDGVNAGNLTGGDSRMKARLKVLPDELRGGAWPSPVRAVRCPVKSGNDRDPHPPLQLALSWAHWGDRRR